MIRDVTMRMSSAVPWNILPDIQEKAILKAKEQKIGQDIRANRIQDQSTDSSADYGSGGSSDTNY